MNSNSEKEQEQLIEKICDQHDFNVSLFKKKINYLNERRYRLIKYLGRGSFGHVIEAINPNKMNVAIKMINKEKEKNDFLKEVSILQHIQDKEYLIKTFEHFSSVPLQALFIVTELCDCSLLSIINLNKLTKSHIYSITKHLLLGLKELEELKIVHCDIKPDNIVYNQKRNKFMYSKK